MKPSTNSLLSTIEMEIPHLSNKLRSLAHYISDHREQVIFQTIRQLASASGVSEATIMRFVAHFGYEGYSDFLNALREFVTNRLTAADPPKKHENSRLSPLENFKTELRGNAVFTELADLLAAARKILILTSPEAAADAARLKWLLSRLRPGVEAGAEELCRAEEELEALPEDSLVIILTTWHSTLRLKGLAEQVKAKKTPFYLITFNQASALAEFCDHRVVLKDYEDLQGLSLPLAVKLLAELAGPSLSQRYQEYQQRLDRIALKHQPLSERRDTLQLAIGHEIRSLDPASAHSLMREAMIMRCVFQGLVKFKDGTWEVAPELAENWQESSDGRSVIFYLRPGVQFHHGYGELSAHDVKFSFERLAFDPEILSSQPAWESLEEVVILSRYAVKLVLRHPCPHLFTSILPMTSGLIVSKKAFEQMGHSQYSTNPVGTGPYAVTGFHPRETLEMEAFDGFWGPKPKTSRLVFRLDVHAFNFPYHFNKGRIDAAVFPNVSPQLINDVPGLLVDNRRALQFWWMGLLVDKPPFDRPAVRQAVRLALDKKKIVESGLPGTEPLHTLIPAGVPGHWAEAPMFPYAPDQARRLMAEAGVEPGIKISLGADPSEIDFAVLEIIRANLADIGFDVRFELSNRQLLLEKIKRGRCDMYIFFFNAHQDAYPSLRWFVKGQFYNFSHWDNPRYTELVARIGRETNEEERLRMVIEAQRMIIDAAWSVWLAQGHNSIIYNDYVDIGLPLPDGFLAPWTMHKKV